MRNPDRFCANLHCQKCINYYGINCYACGMNFAEVYGDKFAGFIHVHHLTPLSEINKEYEINPETDLRPICPNCHAVAHFPQSQDQPLYSIEEIKVMLKKQKKQPT